MMYREFLRFYKSLALEDSNYRVWKTIPWIGEICEVSYNFKAIRWRKNEYLKEGKYQNEHFERKGNMEKRFF